MSMVPCFLGSIHFALSCDKLSHTQTKALLHKRGNTETAVSYPAVSHRTNMPSHHEIRSLNVARKGSMT